MAKKKDVFYKIMVRKTRQEKWEDWTGIFKASEGYNEQLVIKHKRTHFNDKDFEYGLFKQVVDKEVKERDWQFLRLI